ncbi:hypothetical protein QBC35DRAFT_501904 [Podospora australis]|uniref:tyrosinase n=1 Tax=Podospora australis TaxID=1536484 RepID=A0AAN6WRN0_9PEZI|nr:hypothetical protein QBC35DRAFT_501904 [Podospora australis]
MVYGKKLLIGFEPGAWMETGIRCSVHHVLSIRQSLPLPLTSYHHRLSKNTHCISQKTTADMVADLEIPGVSLRKDIEHLTPQELDLLVTAFQHIMYTLPPTDDNSFFKIAGYHGMPFRGAGWGNPNWWGGYCNHGNILFPTWHRAYLHRLEEALRSAPGCENVSMAYWNETKTDLAPDEDGNSQKVFSGVPPAAFLNRTHTFQDGRTIPNPLFSFKLSKSIVDNTTPADANGNYSKPIHYETVRYPFSGLVGKADIDATEVHNQTWKDLGEQETDKILCDNVFRWLNKQEFKNSQGKTIYAGVGKKFQDCLDAPNYTVFSNTTSAKAWNDDHMDEMGFKSVVPLESPHNSIHLAVGGFELPDQGSRNVIEGANGDMGENDTASFDPIFFFHHCFIDYVFWQWQERHGATEKLDKEYARDVPTDKYPGTNSMDSQGPTPGVPGNVWLTLDSALDPFYRKEGEQKIPLTSRDVTNIVNLGYQYPPTHVPEKKLLPHPAAPVLRVSGANRAAIRGSFVISTWARTEPGQPDRLVDVEPILSRWHVSGCANCQTHLDAGTHIALRGVTAESARETEFYAMLHTRDNMKGVEHKTMKFVVGGNADH